MADAPSFAVDIQPVVKASEEACANLIKVTQEAERLTKQVEAIDARLGYTDDKQKRIFAILEQEHPDFQTVKNQIASIEKDIQGNLLQTDALAELIKLPGAIEVPHIKNAGPEKRSKIYL